MHITLRQFDIFAAVARTGSYTGAANELCLSQPAVSQQIKCLEEQTGLPLLENQGRRKQLTHAGRELLAFANNIQQQVKEADALFEGLRDLSKGHLVVSVATTASHFTMRLLASFSRQHPETSFALDVTNRKSLLQQLCDNETDIVIMGQPPEDMSLDSVAIMQNPLVVVASPDHPLADFAKRSKLAIPLSQIEEESFVVREPESGTRLAMQRFFEERGIRFQASVEMTSNEAIKQAVEAGLGLGIVSHHTLELELLTERLQVLPVEGFPVLRNWFVVTRKGKRLSPLAVSFKTFAIEQAKYHAHLPASSA